jgi:nicotinamidase-related amidase
MSRSALLVMDMINDLVHPLGPNATTYAPIVSHE